MSDEPETKQCSNCKLDILSNNFTIHSVHCERNYYLCTICEQPVNKNNKSEHEKTYHVVVHCDNCHLALEKYLLEDHLANDCPDRKIKCKICDIEVKATDIAEHENYCGSRTEKCFECGEYVMLKYKSLHLDSNHTFMKLTDEPGPSPSWQFGRRRLCNFMPDLSEKTASTKPSIRKTKSSEHMRRLRRSGSKDDSDEVNSNSIESSNSEKEDGYVESKTTSVSASKSGKRATRKVSESDEWPALSSLRSLQISEEESDSPTGSQASNSRQAEEESDLMYAIQVSQEINSDIWRKSFSKSDEAFKNSFKPSARTKSSDKLAEKNMLGENPEKENDKTKVDPSKYDFNYSYDSHESVKLPCEFCGSLIVSNELVVHQSMCSLYFTDRFSMGSDRYRSRYFDEDKEKKYPCGICHKFFRLSLLDNHLLHCQKTPPRSVKYKMNTTKNLKAINMKCEQGLQNGLEASSPHLTRMGTRSQWLSELSKNNEGGEDIQNNLNHPEPPKGVVPKTTKVSRKTRRAPSPPKK